LDIVVQSFTNKNKKQSKTGEGFLKQVFFLIKFFKKKTARNLFFLKQSNFSLSYDQFKNNKIKKYEGVFLIDQPEV